MILHLILTIFFITGGSSQSAYNFELLRVTLTGSEDTTCTDLKDISILNNSMSFHCTGEIDSKDPLKNEIVAFITDFHSVMAMPSQKPVDLPWEILINETQYRGFIQPTGQISQVAHNFFNFSANGMLDVLLEFVQMTTVLSPNAEPTIWRKEPPETASTFPVNPNNVIIEKTSGAAAVNFFAPILAAEEPYNFELMSIQIKSDRRGNDMNCTSLVSISVNEKSLQFYCSGYAYIPDANNLTVWITDSNPLIPVNNDTNITLTVELDKRTYSSLLLPGRTISQVSENALNFSLDGGPNFYVYFLVTPVSDIERSGCTTSGGSPSGYNFQLLSVNFISTSTRALIALTDIQLFGQYLNFYLEPPISFTSVAYITDLNSILPMVSLDPIDLPLSVTINGTIVQNYIVPADNSSFGRVVQSKVYPAAYSPNLNMTLSFIQMPTDISCPIDTTTSLGTIPSSTVTTPTTVTTESTTTMPSTTTVASTLGNTTTTASPTTATMGTTICPPCEPCPICFDNNTNDNTEAVTKIYYEKEFVTTKKSYTGVLIVAIFEGVILATVIAVFLVLRYCSFASRFRRWLFGSANEGIVTNRRSSFSDGFSHHPNNDESKPQVGLTRPVPGSSEAPYPKRQVEQNTSSTLNSNVSREDSEQQKNSPSMKVPLININISEPGQRSSKTTAAPPPPISKEYPHLLPSHPVEDNHYISYVLPEESKPSVNVEEAQFVTSTSGFTENPPETNPTAPLGSTEDLYTEIDKTPSTKRPSEADVRSLNGKSGIVSITIDEEIPTHDAPPIPPPRSRSLLKPTDKIIEKELEPTEKPDESTEITTQPTLHQKEDPSKPNTDTDHTPEPGSELLPQVDPSKANDPQGLIDHNDPTPKPEDSLKPNMTEEVQPDDRINEDKNDHHTADSSDAEAQKNEELEKWLYDFRDDPYEDIANYIVKWIPGMEPVILDNTNKAGPIGPSEDKIEDDYEQPMRQPTPPAPPGLGSMPGNDTNIKTVIIEPREAKIEEVNNQKSVYEEPFGSASKLLELESPLRPVRVLIIDDSTILPPIEPSPPNPGPFSPSDSKIDNDPEETYIYSINIGLPDDARGRAETTYEEIVDPVNGSDPISGQAEVFPPPLPDTKPPQPPSEYRYSWIPPNNIPRSTNYEKVTNFDPSAIKSFDENDENAIFHSLPKDPEVLLPPSMLPQTEFSNVGESSTETAPFYQEINSVNQNLNNEDSHTFVFIHPERNPEHQDFNNELIVPSDHLIAIMSNGFIPPAPSILIPILPNEIRQRDEPNGKYYTITHMGEVPPPSLDYPLRNVHSTEIPLRLTDEPGNQESSETIVPIHILEHNPLVLPIHEDIPPNKNQENSNEPILTGTLGSNLIPVIPKTTIPPESPLPYSGTNEYIAGSVDTPLIEFTPSTGKEYTVGSVAGSSKDDNNSFLVPGINFETNISDQLNVNREDGTGVQNEDPDIPSTAEEKDNSNEDFVHVDKEDEQSLFNLGPVDSMTEFLKTFEFCFSDS